MAEAERARLEEKKRAIMRAAEALGRIVGARKEEGKGGSS